MNSVTLIGNLVTDPEADGRAPAARFILEVERPGGGFDRVAVIARGRQAEVILAHLAAGRRVAVDGRLRSYEGGSEDLPLVEVEVNRIQFLSATPAGAAP
jgi:single-stranded DNA-binding protein